MSPQWIVVAVLIAVIYFIYIKKKPLSGEKKSSKDDKQSGDDMVACKKCDTYITLDDALIKDGSYYCSKECLNA